MNLLNYIGNTPLIKLNCLPQNYANIYVKLEYFNPGGSVKTRVAARMIEDAEREDRIRRGDIIIEATGGNTGVGLAIVSNLKGYKLLTVVPDNYSQKRIGLLKVYGAKVILSDSSQGNDSHIKLVEELVEKHPEYIWLNQFMNESSIKAHYYGTGAEIYEMIHPDAFVACVGSAGTFQGIGSFLKEKNPSILLYAVQPKGCNLKEGTAIKHKVQGVSLGIVPPLLDYSIIADYIDVEFDEIKKLLSYISKKEGLFLGISSGANILGAVKIAKQLGAGKVICTVAPDSGDNYMEDLFF